MEERGALKKTSVPNHLGPSDKRAALIEIGITVLYVNFYTIFLQTSIRNSLLQQFSLILGSGSVSILAGNL